MKRHMQLIIVCALLLVALLSTIPLCAYQHEPTQTTFPEQLATLARGQITDYEPRFPGLGSSVGYNGPGITATVYLYTMGLKTIPHHLDSPLLKNHFKQAAGDVVSAGERGLYQNIKKQADEVVRLNDTKPPAQALHTSFTYQQHGQARISHLYLMSAKNHYIKIRFTYDKDQQQAAEVVLREFLKQLAQKIYQ